MENPNTTPPVDTNHIIEERRAKLAELRKQNEKKQEREDTKTDIGWGHQIRSYVLDQSRIKDLRTNIETGNTQSILDGNLDRSEEHTSELQSR